LSNVDAAATTSDTLTFIQAAVHMSRPMIAFIFEYLHLFSLSSTNCSLLVGGPLPVEVVLATYRLFSLGLTVSPLLPRMAAILPQV
jgi:hypothetical protein